MRKTLGLFTVALLLTTPLFARYMVILKDGSRYKAKEKWTVVNGKAIVVLETGGTMQIDPSLIDIEKTNAVNKLGLGDVNIIAVQEAPTASTQGETSSLGSEIRLRKPQAGQAPAPRPQAGSQRQPAAAPPASGQGLGNDVLAKFAAAYENVSLYDAAVTSPGAGRVRVEVTADNEDKVFKAISATSYMMIRIPQTGNGAKIDMVELFMKTINGGAAGRFQMTQADAKAIDDRSMTLPMYFVSKVIY